MKMINQALCGSLILALSTVAAPKAAAHEDGWATAGKVLSGLAIANVLHNVFAPRVEPTVVYTAPPAYFAPAPPVVYIPVPVSPPPPVVYYYPARPVVVVARPPVYYYGNYRYGYGPRPHGWH